MGTKLHLDNPHLVYFEGGVITGTFTFTLTKHPINCQVVTVALYGECKARAIEMEDKMAYDYEAGR